MADIRVKAKATGTPRPELGQLTEGQEYTIDESLFDAEVFDQVVDQELEAVKPKTEKRRG